MVVSFDKAVPIHSVIRLHLAILFGHLVVFLNDLLFAPQDLHALFVNMATISGIVRIFLSFRLFP